MRWNKEQDQRLVAYICSKQLAEVGLERCLKKACLIVLVTQHFTMVHGLFDELQFQTTADLYAEFLAENTHYPGLDMAAIVRRVSRWKRGWLDLKDDRPQSQSLKGISNLFLGFIMILNCGKQFKMKRIGK